MLFAVAPLLNRALARGTRPRVIAKADNNVVVLYRWRMMPIIVVTLVGYPTGLLSQPRSPT